MMKKLFCLVATFLLTVLSFAPYSFAEQARFRGWNKADHYQFIQLGVYPQDDAQILAPVLWRVMTTDEDAGTAMLIADKVIDTYPIIWVQSKKDRQNQNFRRISSMEESDLYTYMNSTMADTMFTKEEAAALIHSRGVLFVLTAEEMKRPDYGFTKSVYGAQPTRVCPATPYAISKGCYQDRGTHGASYWVNDIRTPKGYRMRIVGYNGHMSYGGYSRQNIGVRPAILVQMDKVIISSGTGTQNDPFVLSIK